MRRQSLLERLPLEAGEVLRHFTPGSRARRRRRRRDIAGEMSLLDPAPRSATIVAEGDCLVLEIGGADFRLVLDEIPQVTHKLLTTMAARVRDLDTAVLG